MTKDNYRWTFAYCPECGAHIKQNSFFGSKPVPLFGKSAHCDDCGIEWSAFVEEMDEEDEE